MQLLVTVAPTARLTDGADPDGVAEHAPNDTDGSPHSALGRFETALWSLSPWDAHALEAAVGLGEADDGIEVVTATVGPPAADPVVRAALAKGADRAIRVWDDALADVDLLDPMLTARLLAAVAADVGPTLVLTGARPAPDGFGATGVALASHLGYGWATVVTDISLNREADLVSVQCDRDGGRTERVEVDLPAVLTVGTGCNEPRHAGLRAVRAAQRTDVAVRSLADLGVDPDGVQPSLTPVATADRDRDVTLFEGPPDETATDLARVLRGRGVDP